MSESKGVSAAIHVVLGVAALSIFGGLGVLLCFSYGGVLPIRPNPLTGHVVELRVHGTVLYMTPLQQWLSKGMIGFGLLLGFVTKSVEWWLRGR